MIRRFSLPKTMILVGPVLVILLGLFLLEYMPNEEWDREMANAGLVLNGRIHDAGVVEQMEQVLQRTDPDVVVVGNSYANTDLLPGILAKRLGILPRKVLVFSIPNSVGSHWYAVLKYRVFDNGFRPKMVIVLSGLKGSLITTPISESAMLNLNIHLKEPDSVLEAKLGKRNHFISKLRENRGKLRNQVLHSIRNGWAAPFAFEPPAQRNRRGPSRIDQALNRVFHHSAMDYGLHTDGTPVVELERGEDPYAAEILPTAEDSLVREITELTRRHGTEFLFVRPPMSPLLPEEEADYVIDGTQEAVVDLIEEADGHYLDMRTFPMMDGHYYNLDHMNDEGAMRFTEALYHGIDTMGLWDEGASPVVIQQVRPIRYEWRGLDQALRDSKSGKETYRGQSLRLDPGTGWTVRFDEKWTQNPRYFGVGLALEQEAPFSEPLLEVGGVSVPFATHDTPQGTRRYLAEYEPEGGPETPWDIILTTPEDAGSVDIQGVVIGKGPGRTVLVGDHEAVAGRVVKVVGGVRLDGVGLKLDIPEAIYQKAPQKIPSLKQPLERGVGPMAFYSTQPLKRVSDVQTLEATPFSGRCSPFEVIEDGVPLPLGNVSCDEVFRRGAGRYCHTTRRIFMTAEDGSSPMDNGREYVLQLAQDRSCDSSLWLYAKDQVRLPIGKEDLSQLHNGLAGFSLQVNPMLSRPGHLKVSIGVGSKVLAKRTVSIDEWKSGGKYFSVDSPLSRETEGLWIEVDNPTEAYVMLTKLTLREAAFPRHQRGGEE